MRTKVTLILLLLNVALFFFIFRFERAWRTEDALREARRRVLGAETADIRSLAVASTAPGVPSYTLVRSRGTWFLTQPLDWPANEHAVRPIVQALQFLENETSFSVADLARNGQSLADYGLEKPRITVAFASGDGAAETTPGRVAAAPTTVLQIGDATKVGNRLYVLSPDGKRVHVVNRGLLDVLAVPIEQLRANSLLSIQVFEAKALTVQTGGARVRIAKREGVAWMFDTIVNARASKTRLELAINGLNALRVASFPPTPPTTLPSVAPTLRVTLEGNNRTETLLLGEPVKGADAKENAGNETAFYGQLASGNTVRPPVFIVAVPNELLKWLRDAQTELRERHVLDVDPSTIGSITISAPNQPAISLQRLDANATDSAWQLAIGTRGAANGSTAVAADSDAVHHLLDRLTLLSATAFASDAPSSAQLEAWGFNRPEREITLSTAGAPGTSAHRSVLQLGTDTAGAVYARVDSSQDAASSVYAVDVNLARDFPVDPKAWRDRTVREIPAAARIVHVKVTDLSNNAVLLDRAVGSDDDAKPAADAKAADALAGALRTVRTKRFVADHFADRVAAGGDERAWRYAVDYTVALPGTAAEQTSTYRLYFIDRVGGNQQVAGAKDLDVEFEPAQTLIDALWAVTYAPHETGSTPEKK